MTSPIIHARSSVKRLGGDIDLHMSLHQMLDSSKVAFCDARHRVVYHHMEGVEYLSKTLGKSEEERIHLLTVGVQHIREDMGGRLVTAQDWIEQIDSETMPRVLSLDYSFGAKAVLERYGGVIEDYEPVIEWLSYPAKWVDHKKAGIFSHHSFGCFAAERNFGAEVLLNNGRRVPTRYICETWINGVYGYVPSLSRWCESLRLCSWMNWMYKI